MIPKAFRILLRLTSYGFLSLGLPIFLCTSVKGFKIETEPLYNVRFHNANSVRYIQSGNHRRNQSKLWSTVERDVRESRTNNESKETAVDIATSFVLDEFKPAAFATNPHVQTILGVLLRTYPEFSYWDGSWQSILKEKHNLSMSDFWAERKRFETPDGDFFDVDYKYVQDNYICNTPGNEREIASTRGLVIMTHGIESSSDSPLSHDMARAFLAKGFDVACINFRGCSGELNRNIGGYHFGFTDDLKQLIIETNNDKRNGQKAPIFLSGFSLGANVVLKLLGELGDTAKDLNIWGCAVTGAPFSCFKSNEFMLKSSFSQAVYIKAIVKSLRDKAIIQVESNPGSSIDINKLRSVTTQAEYENVYTAPIYGFKDYVDYYAKTECDRFIDSISVPTLVVNSIDDPFFPPDSIPNENIHRPLNIARTQHGGHLGFMFHRVEARSKHMANASWMPTELARFISHAYDKTTN